MRTVIAIPPMSRMTGGIAVLYQVAARLRECGHEVTLAGVADAPGLAAEAARGCAVLPWEALAAGPENFLRQEDVFVAAEGWPNMLAPALAARSRILVYAQNWAYVFSALPEGVSWRALPVAFLAVSEPVGRFVGEMAGLPLAGCVRPSIDASLFRPAQVEDSRTVRVAWMPRKNKALAEQIRQIATAADGAGGRRVEWVAIHRMTPEEVAKTLGECHIFLATGFPEGCPLPPLEAMASGCVVVGFSGFGGWDYMRQGREGGFAPRFAPRPVPWGGNGLFASDGDVMEAALLLNEAVAMVRGATPAYAALRAEGLKTAAAYSVAAQRDEVRAIWDAFKGHDGGHGGGRGALGDAS